MRDSHLVDRFGRSIDYLRLSVTDSCDLRCSYCRPAGRSAYHEPADWLGFGELERSVAAFARLGVRCVRLTGGEPLLRRDLPRLAERLAALPGIGDLSLSANAIRLMPMAARLEEALRAAMALKPERHEFREQPAKVLRRMSMTGG
jgi:cyclic pyranopterin phosphate synthase